MYIGDNVEEPDDVDLLLHFGHPEHDEFSPPIYPISVHGVTNPGGPSAGVIDVEVGCDPVYGFGCDPTQLGFGFGEQAPEGFAHGDFGHDLVITHGDITITQHAGEFEGEIRRYG